MKTNGNNLSATPQLKADLKSTCRRVTRCLKETCWQRRFFADFKVIGLLAELVQFEPARVG